MLILKEEIEIFKINSFLGIWTIDRNFAIENRENREWKGWKKETYSETSKKFLILQKILNKKIIINYWKFDLLALIGNSIVYRLIYY